MLLLPEVDCYYPVKMEKRQECHSVLLEAVVPRNFHLVMLRQTLFEMSL